MNKFLYFTLSFFLILIIKNAYAQDGSYSLYSYYRFGDPMDPANVENSAMGHFVFYSDTLHYNHFMPSSVAGLKYVNYTFSLTSNSYRLSSANSSSRQTSFLMPYLNLGIPIKGIGGFGIGFRPYSSSGFLGKKNISDDEHIIKKGDGGLNEFFLTAGIKPYKSIHIGAGYHYYFGDKEYQVVHYRQNIFTITYQNDNAFYRGNGFDFSFDFKQQLAGLIWKGGLYYRPRQNITSENKSTLKLVDNSYGNPRVINQVTLRHDTTLQFLPAKWSAGFGLGKKTKWFAGLEYENADWSGYTNDFFTTPYVSYGKQYDWHLGGYWIPDHRIHVKYWKRINYRFGFYTGQTGLILKNTPIKHFGITFGMVLPIRNYLSNAAVDFEYEHRGTKANGLILENIFKIKINVSLNARWFTKRKIN